jgi:hypothetical protein
MFELNLQIGVLFALFFTCMHLYVVTNIYTIASFSPSFPLIFIPHRDRLRLLVEKEGLHAI